MENDAYYGHQEEKSRYPLAAHIWGHRLRECQHWMEYLLEFLNVLAGFNYRLGQGLDREKGRENYLEKYIRLPKMGLRRFVFYDEREKTTDQADDHALEILLHELEDVIGNGGDQKKAIACVRNLFRSLSAVEDSRSWFAKSLFPVNHHLLFWEGERNISKRRAPPPSGLPPYVYDTHIALTGRNFFARGGEIYYLILSAGTQQAIESRGIIAQRLEKLLKESNQDLGIIANLIDQAWYRKYYGEDSSVSGNRGGEPREYPLGWIPDPDCSLYRIIAEDVAAFLQNDLELFECLALFACLISFHLSLYIYHRAQPNTTSILHDLTCYSSYRPLLLVHVAEGEGNNAIKEISERLFRQQGSYQEQKARDFMEAQIRARAMELEQEGNFSLNLANDMTNFFSLESKETNKNARISQLQKQFLREEIDKETFLRDYSEALWKIAEPDLVKNFLGVHRKLTKAAGFVSPKTGNGGRFVLGDDLLKVLVLANVPAHTSMTFDDFLYRIHNRYGIIVGPEEARSSGLVNLETVNMDYYGLNRRALLEKMKRAGLVTQYSDATALVQG